VSVRHRADRCAREHTYRYSDASDARRWNCVKLAQAAERVIERLAPTLRPADQYARTNTRQYGGDHSGEKDSSSRQSRSPQHYVLFFVAVRLMGIA
jgi:hypothetical protein